MIINARFLEGIYKMFPFQKVMLPDLCKDQFNKTMVS